VGLGWYITVAGEDAQDAVIKPYLESIASFNKGTFPARDYTVHSTTAQSQSIPSDRTISIKLRAISIRTDIGHTIHVINPNGKTVYRSVGRGAGDFGFPHLKPGVYLVKVIAGKKNCTGKVAFFKD
jgi:hypothetical protein